MIGAVIGIIFVLVILGAVWWGVQQLIGLVPIAEPFGTIIRVVSVILLVIVCIWVATVLLGLAGIHVNTFGWR